MVQAAVASTSASANGLVVVQGPPRRMAFGLRHARVPSAPAMQPRGPAPRSRCALVCSARSGGSVLDNPVTLPGVRPGKQTNKRRGPTYKVMLHNDNHNRREYVIATLMKVVKGMTVDDAATVMQVAHETGVAMVISCPQEEAETYCGGLRLNGLTSSIEPERC